MFFQKIVILAHYGTLKVKIVPNKGIFNTFFSSFFHSISNFLIQPTESTIFNTCIITIIIYRNRAFHWYPIYPLTVKIEWATPSSNAPYIPFDVQVSIFLNCYPFQFIWTLEWLFPFDLVIPLSDSSKWHIILKLWFSTFNIKTNYMVLI